MYDQFYIIILAIVVPIVYKLPILGTKKFSTLILATTLWLTFVMSSPSKSVMYEIWILISIFIFYVLYLGYKITKQIENKIVVYINEEVKKSNTNIQLKVIMEILYEDLNELSMINDKEKYIKETIEILNKKKIFSSPITIQ